MSFDYGCDEKQMSVSYGVSAKQWLKKGEFTGLFDADTIPYLVGYTSTEEEYGRYKRGDEDVWQEKIQHASYIINATLEAAKCDSAIFYVTDSASNFRLEVGTLKVYKGQRKTEKPPFFAELKDWLVDYHDAKVSHNCEADDEISIESWRRFMEFAEFYDTASLFKPAHRASADSIILSADKDLNIIPGWHRGLKADDEPYWVDPIGELNPQFKEVEVIAYEYWPLFDKEPVNPKHLFALVSENGELEPKLYSQIADGVEQTLGWETDYLWCDLSPQGKAVSQDLFTRGRSAGEGKFKRVSRGKKTKKNLTKLKGSGLSFFYSQLITGDTVDNYPGIPGKGPKAAFDLLVGATTEAELCKRVLAAYLKEYKSEVEARHRMLEQGQLAWMQTKKGELWQIPDLKKSQGLIYPSFVKS